MSDEKPTTKSNTSNPTDLLLVSAGELLMIVTALREHADGLEEGPYKQDYVSLANDIEAGHCTPRPGRWDGKKYL